MATAEVRITHIAEARNLRVLGVQLNSPFRRDRDGNAALRFNAQTRLPIWDAQRRANPQRIEQVHRILGSLTELYVRQPIDIIAFPEYSVPREAHEDGRFQAFADANNCILVPGTYIDDRPDWTSTFRRNMCQIYLPGREEPVIIGKATPTPDEGKYVLPYGGANIARLVWEPPGRDAVSISIFICRDLLTPYSSPLGTSSLPSVRHELDVDWDREGLHLALLHSDETRQFEAVAGLDLRNLRGRRKMTFIVNNANWARELGTALFGPASNREREDIVRSLPVDSEAILSADLRLWDVRTATERPDRSIDEPVGSVSEHPIAPESAEEPSVGSIFRHVIVQGGDNTLALDTIEDQRNAAFRGVWRTAYLAAEGMVLSLEFYKAQKLNAAVKIVKSEVGNAYSGVVRGEHDLLIRRYVHVEEVEQPGGPNILEELDVLTRRDLRAALGPRDGDPMKITILAHDIWKYRGRCVIDSDFDRRKTLLRDALTFRDDQSDRRGALIENILTYADECAEGARPPEPLKPFFYDEPEEVIAVRPYTELRETYIFLDIKDRGQPGSEQFENQVLKENLMVDPKVREIFKLSSPGQFNYLIKLKCKAHEADNAGMDIRDWAEKHGVDCAMRTVDIMEYLGRQSVRGIKAASKDQTLREFIRKLRSEELREDDPVIAKLVYSKTVSELETVAGCARAWAACQGAPGTHATRALRHEILSFFGNTLFFSAGGDLKYVVRAQDAWLHIYRGLEACCDTELQSLYNKVTSTPPDNEFQRNDVLKDHFVPDWNPDQWKRHREQSIRVAQRVFEEALRGTTLAKDLKASSADVSKFVTVDRNTFAHGSRPEKVRELLNLSDGAAGDKLDRMRSSVMYMVRAMDLVVEANEKVRITPNPGS